MIFNAIDSDIFRLISAPSPPEVCDAYMEDDATLEEVIISNDDCEENMKDDGRKESTSFVIDFGSEVYQFDNLISSIFNLDIEKLTEKPILMPKISKQSTPLKNSLRASVFALKE